MEYNRAFVLAEIDGNKFQNNSYTYTIANVGKTFRFVRVDFFDTNYNQITLNNQVTQTYNNSSIAITITIKSSDAAKIKNLKARLWGVYYEKTQGEIRTTAFEKIYTNNMHEKIEPTDMVYNSIDITVDVSDVKLYNLPEFEEGQNELRLEPNKNYILHNKEYIINSEQKLIIPENTTLYNSDKLVIQGNLTVATNGSYINNGTTTLSEGTIESNGSCINNSIIIINNIDNNATAIESLVNNGMFINNSNFTINLLENNGIIQNQSQKTLEFDELINNNVIYNYGTLKGNEIVEEAQSSTINNMGGQVQIAEYTNYITWEETLPSTKSFIYISPEGIETTYVYNSTTVEPDGTEHDTTFEDWYQNEDFDLKTTTILNNQYQLLVNEDIDTSNMYAKDAIIENKFYQGFIQPEADLNYTTKDDNIFLDKDENQFIVRSEIPIFSVYDGNSESSTLIGNYNFTDNMTFEDWLNSDYNLSGAYGLAFDKNGNNEVITSIFNTEGRNALLKTSEGTVTTADSINAENKYYLQIDG